MGSRFTSRVQRVSGNTPERLTVMTMLVGNLKEERQRANLVLDGLQALKAVRTFVQHDSFDKAVRVADESLQKLPGLYCFTEVNDMIQFYSFILDNDNNLTHELDQQIILLAHLLLPEHYLIFLQPQ